MFSLYAKLAAVAALLVALGGLYWKIHHDGVVVGRAEIQAKWDADNNARKVAEDKAIENRLRKNELLKKQNDTEKLELKASYEIELATLRTARTKPTILRVHTDNCARPAGTAESGSASGGNANPAGTGILSSDDSTALLSLMDKADEIVASCRIAQDFLKSQGMAP